MKTNLKMLLHLFASPLHSVVASIFAVCKINLQENKNESK